jgi:hypothetical protein
MTELAGKVGFASPVTEKKLSKRRAGVELFATGALAVCLVVAVTAVSIGMAHAEGFGTVRPSNGASLAVAVFLGAVFAGMGGLTAVAARERGALRR